MKGDNIMTAPTPTLTKKALLRVNTGTTESPVWTEVRGMKAYQETMNYTNEDTTTFDDGLWKGADWTYQIGWGLQITVLRNTYGGAQDPGQEFLRIAAVPQDETSQPKLVEIQVVDRFKGPECYQGSATVQWSPQSANLSEVQVTLSGAGFRQNITNPLLTAEVPAISAAEPTGAGEGELVTISGARFTGATAVKFGATNAADFAVVTDARIVASLPAGSAGSAAITVTTAAGASTAFPYTRGA